MAIGDGVCAGFSAYAHVFGRKFGREPSLYAYAPTGPKPLPTADAALPDGPPLPLKQAMIAPEKRIIEQALAWCDGNRERAAEVLGINRSTLFHKLKKLGIR